MTAGIPILYKKESSIKKYSRQNINNCQYFFEMNLSSLLRKYILLYIYLYTYILYIYLYILLNSSFCEWKVIDYIFPTAMFLSHPRKAVISSTNHLQNINEVGLQKLRVRNVVVFLNLVNVVVSLPSPKVGKSNFIVAVE